MPHMNRIRVNNVKYNFGQQMYDDFVLRLHGKNTIYDLANGGGKSVLMLLLLQNLIPNCTLDDKQPIEKLFRTSGGSTTIHSLVEWNLDEGDIEDDYRFMLTGFCARKAKDVSDDDSAEKTRDTASIDYFNYCIFYRAYNENDLVNLPLVKDGERVTYNGLKQYLKDLDRDVASLKIYIFERKGEYQQFISKYGLYESAWEIVRGINKTEGHVRTYFETNYKTTRKVVEDLLIEEIIEKSFRDKTDQEDINESMAKTLLDIKDKLMELSEKKNEMNKFEHQKELLNVLSSRVQALGELYEEKDVLSSELLSAYQMLKRRVDDEERELLKQKKQIEEQDAECREKDRVIACLKVQLEEDQLRQLKKTEQDAFTKMHNAKTKFEEQEKKYIAKENANEYLEMKRFTKQCSEQQRIIDKARGGAGNNMDRLYDLASIKRDYMDRRLDGVRENYEIGAKLEHDLKVELKAMMKTKRELECEHAVAKANADRLQIVAKTKEEELNKVKKDLNLLLLEDLPAAERDKRREVSSAAKELEQLKEKEQEGKDLLQDLYLKQKELNLQLEYQSTNGSLQKQISDQLEKSVDRVKALASAYEMDLPETMNLAFYQSLSSKAKERLVEANAALIEYQALVAKYQKLVDAKAAGQLVADTDLITEICQYLAERHELNITLGQDYVLGLEESQRRSILTRIPFLPYGLVVSESNFEAAKTVLLDDNLRALCEAQMIPIFIAETLSDVETEAKEGYFFLHGQEQGLYVESGFGAEVKEYSAKLEEAQRSVDTLSGAIGMLEEDQIFLLECQQLFAFLDAQKEQDEESKDINKELEEVSFEMVSIQEKLVECKQLIETSEKAYAKSKEEQERLSGIAAIWEAQQTARQEANEQIALEQDIAQRMFEADGSIETKNHLLKETREKNASYMKTIQESESLWESLFAEYYQEGRRVLDLGYTEDQIDAEFGSLRTVVEKGLGNVADKQELVDTLLRNIDRLEQNLARRGADLEELNVKYDAGELSMSGEADLMMFAKEKARYQQSLEQARAELTEAQKAVNKTEGRIEHGLKQLEEQGISYARLNMESNDVKRALEEQKEVFASLLQSREELTNAFIALQKQHARRSDFYKDVRRIKELYHLQVEEGQKLPDLSEYSFDQLKKCQQKFERVMSKESRARQDLEQYKNQTAQGLTDLGALELAEVIRRDVTLPETVGQMKELIDSLKDMVGFITLEQERVEQGIQDMQLIKSNFESQCIRRCQDVRTELTRLPNLSSITLDGENIQMIDLKIPYVADDQMSVKMSDYIDQIVKDVDRYETFADRMRFIRGQLALKRLFSVIVTDMNAIRLQLYKRERIKEQSRYLRYEEAVGSTGQSQGIYIQFLIAVINYIANIHSVNSDNNDLGKVIFIDNPFGAAKDIYIWEPIFEMLKTNNVQLIVPARGATPAITGRFDVNYILGQKMVGGKQQTVVVDYRSQVDKTEVEYKRLEFSQTSFDFI